MYLKGSIVALVTPFLNGEIDWDSLENLIELHLKSGTNAILAAGTTGEAAVMTESEYKKVISFIAEKTEGKIPVLAGTGLNDTQATIRRTKIAADSGANYALTVTPYYNKPGHQGLLAHYTTIADESPIPVVLYNVPSRTGINMQPKTVLELAEHPNIRGIKEASGNVGQAAEILSEAPKGFNLYSGDDKINYPLMTMGAAGAISVVANIVPSFFAKSMHLFEEQKYNEAREMYFKLLKLSEVLFIETNPAPAKAALHLAGVIKSLELRLPLTTLSEASLEVLSEALNELKTQNIL